MFAPCGPSPKLQVLTSSATTTELLEVSCDVLVLSVSVEIFPRGFVLVLAIFEGSLEYAEMLRKK